MSKDKVQFAANGRIPGKDSIAVLGHLVASLRARRELQDVPRS